MRERHHRQYSPRWVTHAAIAIACVALFGPPRVGHAEHRRPHQFPRTANLYLKWHLSEAEARELAHSWDVIILDMEVQANSRRELELLRRLNPRARVFAYVTSQEVRRDVATNPQAPLRRRLAARIPDAWHLQSLTGDRVFWWPQTWLLNITDHTPLVNGMRWPETLAAFVAEELTSSGLWDGVYYDNLWAGISWFDRDTVDLDGNGQSEDATTRDQWWSDGVRRILRETRVRVPEGFLITGNGSPNYASDTNGILLEHFPSTTEGDWSRSMVAYRSIIDRAVAPALAMLNSNTGNTGRRDDWQAVRFGLASALLGEGYFGFDFGDREHAQLWSYDEYDVHLGQPKGPPRVVGAAVGSSTPPGFPRTVYRRDFTNGISLVNATDASAVVALDGEFERIHGRQDPTTNDGTVTEEVSLPSRDGLLLLRPLATVVGAPFTNGAFARVFRPDGTVARTGFFAYDSRFRGGTTVASVDVDRDGVLETITADQSTVRILRSEREVLRFQPFGRRFTGGFSFALLDSRRDGRRELAVAPRAGGGTIGIFDLSNGRRIGAWLAPFGLRERGGLSITAIDIDGDATPEIAVGRANGPTPDIAVIRRSGERVGRILRAFPLSVGTGVRLAAGDLNGDGRDELAIGVGTGSRPRVRVIDPRSGRTIVEFDAFSPTRQHRVDVAIADLDGDGRAELLGMSTQAFTIAGTRERNGGILP